MSMPRMLFLTAGGRHPEYSSGHISRCIMTAARIGKTNPQADFLFAMPQDKAGENIFLKAGHRPVTYKPSAEKKVIGKTIINYQPHMIVLDRLDVPPALMQWLKKFGKILISLDDSGRGARLADISINPLIPNKASYYPGYAYLTLSDLKIKKVPVKIPARQCLIAFGGFSQQGLTLKVLKALRGAKWAKQIRLDVFAAIDDTQQKQIVHELQFFAAGSRVHAYSDHFLEKLSKSDAALVAGGLTMFEASRLQIPSGIIALRDHQKINISKMSHKKLVLDLGATAEIKSTRFLQRVEMLLQNARVRKMLASKSFSFWSSLKGVAETTDLLQIVTLNKKSGRNSSRQATLWTKRSTKLVQAYVSEFCEHHHVGELIKAA